MSNEAQVRIIATAMWEILSYHEDRCDLTIDEVEPEHHLWEMARAALAAIQKPNSSGDVPSRGNSIHPQPLEAVSLPNALLRLDTLAAATGLSIKTLYRKANAGELEMVKIGTRCTRVRSEAAREFIRKLGTAA